MYKQTVYHSNVKLHRMQWNKLSINELSNTVFENIKLRSQSKGGWKLNNANLSTIPNLRKPNKIVLVLKNLKKSKISLL